MVKWIEGFAHVHGENTHNVTLCSSRANFQFSVKDKRAVSQLSGRGWPGDAHRGLDLDLSSGTYLPKWFDLCCWREHEYVCRWPPVLCTLSDAPDDLAVCVESASSWYRANLLKGNLDKYQTMALVCGNESMDSIMIDNHEVRSTECLKLLGCLLYTSPSPRD